MSKLTTHITDDDNSCGWIVTGCQDSSSENYVSTANDGGDAL